MSENRVKLIIVMFFLLLAMGEAIESNENSTGVQQEKLLTPEEMITMGNKLLTLLGVNSEARNISKSSPRDMTSSWNKFVMNLHIDVSLEDSEGDPGSSGGAVKNKEFEMTKKELRIFDECDDTIVFPSQRNEAGKPAVGAERIWFNVKTIPKNETLMMAMLRIYQVGGGGEETGAIIINVYREQELVGSVSTTAAYNGWLVLDISKALEHWMKNPAGNRGLSLSTQPATASLENIGIAGFRVDDHKRQTFMVGYFKQAGPDGTRLKLPIVKRDANEGRTTTIGYPKKRGFLDFFKSETVTKKLEPCQMHQLQINFKDLGWDKWFIAPQIFNPGYCDGFCKIPISAHINTTNHAVIQSFIHLLHPEEVPSPCCVPTELAPMSIVLILDKDNVILKKFEDMIVLKCGCL